MANTGNTQQQINYGAAANDGQGDPLRTAFIKTDDNFDAIWNTGPVGSNITILNNTIQTNNVNGNIVLRPNGVGVIQANASIVPNATNLRDLGTSAQRFRAAYIGSGGLSVDGNVTVTGNLTAGNISYTGNVFVGDLQGSVYADDSTIMVDALDNAMFADSATFGAASITGNVSANYFLGNGSLLTGIISSYSNANVANYLVSDFGTFGSNTIVTAGNVVASVIDTGAIVNPFPIGIQGGDDVWQFAGNILRSPEGGTWQSASGTEFISSNTANGFINLVAYNSGNLATELFMEHGFVRIRVDNGGPDQDWNFRVTGTLDVPGDIVPQANAAQSLGNATNQWANLWASTINTSGNVTANNISAGNVFFANNITGTTATFTGDARGRNALYAGVALFTVLGSDVVAQFSGNVDSYTQFNFQNGNSGSLASGDYVITADNGTDSTYFVNLGLGSSNHADPDFFGDTSTPNDAYLYVVGADATGPGDAGPGNLIIGSTNGVIKFFIGNTAQANVVQTITSAGVSITGDVDIDGGITGTGSLNIQAAPNGNAYVNLDDTGESYIGAAANLYLLSDSDNREWIFDTTGTLTAPGDITVGGDITGRAATSTLVIKAQPDSNTYIQLNNTVDSEIRTAANLEIRTDASNTSQTWTFTTDGTLTLPGATAFVDAGADFVGMYSDASENNGIEVYTDADTNIFNTGNVNIYANVAGSPVKTWTFANTGDLTAPGNISATRLQNDANLEIRSNVAGTARIWTFDTLGDLNLPVGGNITGSGGISANNITLTGNISANTAGFAIGYRDIPQVAFTGNATLAATDAGKHFYSTESTDYVLTIADNSAVAWPVGTAVTVVNRGTGNITVAQASGVSLYLAGNSSAGNRTVSTYGMVTLLNVAANVWMINGTGVA